MTDPLSDEYLSRMRALARERVSQKRFQHMEPEPMVRMKRRLA